MTIHSLWAPYPTLSAELDKVNKTIFKHIHSGNPQIDETLTLFFGQGGKLLRPALFLLFTQFGTVPSEQKKYELAASLELLHAATLIHDDIIDDSPLRRNQPSIQARYGKNTAVYTGDFLFTVYFELLTRSAKNQESLQRYAVYMRKVLLGELYQLALTYNVDTTIKQYLKYINGKTAKLFQLSCFMGADFTSQSPKQLFLSQRIGYQLGMAFQIQDDLLDYIGTDTSLKKPVFQDIENGIYTLPLLFTFKKKPELKTFIRHKKTFSKADQTHILNTMQEAQGIEAAQKVNQRYILHALKNIDRLPDHEAKFILQELVQNLLSRTD